MVRRHTLANIEFMEYQVKSRIWIEVENKVLLGEGRVRLLKAIDEFGSLSKASKQLNISYKKAWKLIDAVNKSAKEPVTTSCVGGVGGGGVSLTPYGRKLVDAFETLNRNCWKYLDKQLSQTKF
jgi:molybdate transport system regulatory protein